MLVLYQAALDRGKYYSQHSNSFGDASWGREHRYKHPGKQFSRRSNPSKRNKKLNHIYAGEIVRLPAYNKRFSYRLRPGSIYRKMLKVGRTQ